MSTGASNSFRIGAPHRGLPRRRKLSLSHRPDQTATAQESGNAGAAKGPVYDPLKGHANSPIGLSQPSLTRGVSEAGGNALPPLPQGAALPLRVAWSLVKDIDCLLISDS